MLLECSVDRAIKFMLIENRNEESIFIRHHHLSRSTHFPDRISFRLDAVTNKKLRKQKS